MLVGGLLGLTALAAILVVAAQGKATRDGMEARPGTVGKPELPAPRAARQADAVTRIRLSEGYGRLPLSFEANHGQTNARVKFLSRGPGYSLFLTSTDAVFALRQGSGTGGEGRGERGEGPRRIDPQSQVPNPQSLSVVRMKVIGANSRPRITGLQELPGKVNYFKGNDPTKWRTNISTYAKVEYRDVYPGVNLVYYGNNRQLEYDFVVAPGADPTAIKIAFEGADKIETNTQGDLVLRIAGGELRFHKPLVYQEVAGIRHYLAGDYVLNPQSAIPHSKFRNPHSPVVGFHVAAYDATKLLVIDPVLSYSTYLGGNSGDSGLGIAVDTAGNAYVTGYTGSPDYPVTSGSFNQSLIGFDAFVTKLNPEGSALVYSTYLGGHTFNEATAIAVDSRGNVYVAGDTTSLDYPITPGAFQPTYGGGGSDAFVTKLDPTGSALVYSTYLGGTGVDFGRGIAVDATGSAYVTGYTNYPGFPTTAGAFQRNFGGIDDAFVTKVNPAGSALIYSTYLGGSSTDIGTGVAVDAAGDAYVTGGTTSYDFPTTPGVFQSGYGGGVYYDAFVTKLNSEGSGLIYSTYLGGGGGEWAAGIAVDAAGNAHVTGASFSPDFPTTPGAFQVALGSVTCYGYLCPDAFVTKLNPEGSALVYSTYLGGINQDNGYGIAVDAAGNAYVTGTTSSPDYPITPGAFKLSSGIGFDTFVTKLNPEGSALVYSTYLGGNIFDVGSATAVDVAGNAYVAGSTSSLDYITTPGAFQQASSGNSDVFVTKIPAHSPGASLYGVLSANGQAVAGAEVRLFRDRPLYRPQRPMLVTTGGGGYYAFSGLQPGTYWLQVVPPGTTPLLRSVELAAGEDRRLDVSLTQGGTPTLTLYLYQFGFPPGMTISLIGTVGPDVTPTAVDVYVWLTIPGGAMLFLQADWSLTAEARPMVRNWTVALYSGEIFRYIFRGHEPAGNYTWNAAFTVPGGNPQHGTIGPIVSTSFYYVH